MFALEAEKCLWAVLTQSIEAKRFINFVLRDVNERIDYKPILKPGKNVKFEDYFWEQ